MRIWLVGAVSLLVIAAYVPAAAQERTPAEFRAVIEAAQTYPDAGEFGSMTLDELMAHFGVPGVSIAFA